MILRVDDSTITSQGDDCQTRRRLPDEETITMLDEELYLRDHSNLVLRTVRILQVATLSRRLLLS